MLFHLFVLILWSPIPKIAPSLAALVQWGFPSCWAGLFLRCHSYFHLWGNYNLWHHSRHFKNIQLFVSSLKASLEFCYYFEKLIFGIKPCWDLWLIFIKRLWKDFFIHAWIFTPLANTEKLTLGASKVAEEMRLENETWACVGWMLMFPTSAFWGLFLD